MNELGSYFAAQKAAPPGTSRSPPKRRRRAARLAEKFNCVTCHGAELRASSTSRASPASSPSTCARSCSASRPDALRHGRQHDRRRAAAVRKGYRPYRRVPGSGEVVQLGIPTYGRRYAACSGPCRDQLQEPRYGPARLDYLRVANNALGRSSGIGGLLGGGGRDDDQLAARVNELHQEVQQGGL